jgi:hypothetical protein
LIARFAIRFSCSVDRSETTEGGAKRLRSSMAAEEAAESATSFRCTAGCRNERGAHVM